MEEGGREREKMIQALGWCVAGPYLYKRLQASKMISQFAGLLEQSKTETDEDLVMLAATQRRKGRLLMWASDESVGEGPSRGKIRV